MKMLSLMRGYYIRIISVKTSQLIKLELGLETAIFISH